MKVFYQICEQPVSLGMTSMILINENIAWLWYFMNNKLILTYIAICVSQVNGVGSFMRLPALSSSKNPGSRHA